MTAPNAQDPRLTPRAADMPGFVGRDTNVAEPPPSYQPTPEELRQLLRSANLDRQAGFSLAEIDNNLMNAGWGVSYRTLADAVKALPKQQATTMTSKDAIDLMLSGATLGASDAEFWKTVAPERAKRIADIRESNPVLSQIAELVGSLGTGSVVGGAVKKVVGKVALNALKERIPAEIAKSSLHLDALIEARKNANRIANLVASPIGGAITGAGYREDRKAGAVAGAAAGTLAPIVSAIPGATGNLMKAGGLLALFKALRGK